MVKEVFFFTEMGYTAYSQDVAQEYGYTNLMFPNENFSPEKASELYSMYFEELQYCSEAGFDGVMINEHHNNPLSLMPSVNVIGSVLAKMTKMGKIVFLGNVLPIHENPVRVAEEVAMIDLISGGRVVCGFVRGIGQESMATNTNPVFNRERFEEAFWGPRSDAAAGQLLGVEIVPRGFAKQYRVVSLGAVLKGEPDTG